MRRSGLRVVRSPGKAPKAAPADSLRGFKEEIMRKGVDIAKACSVAAAPELTRMMREAYDGGVDVYGNTRRKGVRGNTLSLVDTGAIRDELKFDRQETTIYAFLNEPYAKYLIGKYKIMPIGDRSAIPAKWVDALRRIVAAVSDVMGVRRAA